MQNHITTRMVQALPTDRMSRAFGALALLKREIANDKMAYDPRSLENVLFWIKVIKDRLKAKDRHEALRACDIAMKRPVKSKRIFNAWLRLNNSI
jgi:hypothetical protein